MISKKRSLALVAVIMGLMATADITRAQTQTQVGILACQNTVVTELGRMLPAADSVRFEPNPRARRATNTTVDVDGGGRVYIASARARRDFVYQCIYHIRSAKTRVWIDVQPPRSRTSFFDEDRSRWRRFSFDCVYDPATGLGRRRVTVDPANAEQLR